MKKNYIRILFISFFLFLILPLDVKADNGYIIRNYDVDIKVNENNVLNIKETIDVDFTIPSHGIFRKIPIKNTYHRKEFDVTTKAKISKININENYTIQTEGNNKIYKIGDSDELITGYKQYIISYDYDIGDDNVDLFDDFYFNIIGTQWSAKIENVTFKVQMPKKFDESLINFTIGYYGATYNKDVIYNVEGNTIIGSVKKTRTTDGEYALFPNEGLTLRIELEEGYFENERQVFDPTKVIVYGLLIGLILMIIFGIKKFKKYSYWKKDLLVPEYVVPYKLTPAALGYLYDGKVNDKQIVSLIIYLANKGYLRIIEESKSKFSFEKIKPIDDSEPNYVKITFNGLFKGTATKVTKSELTNKFYKTLSTALFQLKSSYKIYDSHHHTSSVYYSLMLFSWAFVSFLFSITTYRLDYYYSIQKNIIIFLTITSSILGLIFNINNKKRTKEATNYYNKARGFKDYIENVEKDKIETLVEENPNYFFEILPYAYVLGVTDKWSKKFESITVAPPDWYRGTMYDVSTGRFSSTLFTNSLSKTLSSTTTTMSSRPYESSGGYGGSGGGGFSGGGGGGGGGGRW